MKRLLMEGGGQRGLFSQGVLDAFIEEDIWFDEIDAISSGGLSAVDYKTRDKGRSYRQMQMFTGDPRYFGIGHWLKDRNYFNWDFMFNEIPKAIPFNYQAYRENPMVVKVGVFDIEEGEVHYLEVKDMETEEAKLYLRSTCSLPFYTSLPKIDGRVVCDGGIKECFALDCYRKEDKTVLLATRNKEYRRKELDKVPLYFKMLFPHYKKLQEAYLNRAVKYNKEMERLEKMQENGEIFLVRPSEPTDVTRGEKDKEKLKKLYLQGYSTGKQLAPQLKEYLKD